MERCFIFFMFKSFPLSGRTLRTILNFPAVANAVEHSAPAADRLRCVASRRCGVAPSLRRGRPPLRRGRPPLRCGRPPLRHGRPPLSHGRPPLLRRRRQLLRRRAQLLRRRPQLRRKSTVKCLVLGGFLRVRRPTLRVTGRRCGVAGHHVKRTSTRHRRDLGATSARRRRGCVAQVV